MTDATLTFAERLILANQFSILEILDPDNADTYQSSAEIVASGYSFLYESINPSVSKDEVSIKDCKEVCDILDMHRAFEASCQQLGATAASYGLDYKGLDGNNDHPHYGFAQFMRRKQNRWSELASYPDNSHTMSSLPDYQRMLADWIAMGRPFKMSEAQLRQIAD